MNKLFYLFFLFFIVFSACSSDTPNDEKVIRNIIQELDARENIFNNKAILVLPSYGCQSCLNATIEFIKTHYNNKNLLCIASGTSNKDIRIKLSDKVFDSPNVLIDIKGLVFNAEIENPTAFYFVEGKLVSKIVIKSKEKEPFFADLVDFISE